MKDLGNEQDLQLNLAFLEEACSFASKRGIKFYIAFSPLLDVVESTIEIQNHIADSARRIDEIVAGHSHCMWLAREPLMYPREFMADSQHANFKGAKYFTEYLIRQLINQL